MDERDSQEAKVQRMQTFQNQKQYSSDEGKVDHLDYATIDHKHINKNNNNF